MVCNLRLSYVNLMLGEIEKKTLAPTSLASSAIAAFDLYLNENRGYDPTDSYWQFRWRDITSNMDNWRVSTQYIRVFQTSARFAAQGVLIAASLLLALLLVLSLYQAWQGKGAFKIDKAKMTKEMTQMAHEGMDAAQKAGNRISKKVHQTISSVKNALKETRRL